ncbi:MAG: TRAP transporter small permease [Deltaproteobacteria bacterium]|nr:TRAP transporter small permease [Deltaproteobacteria bacterium]
MAESVYKRIDRGVYLVERAIVVTSLLVMAIVVFLDVVHRSFSGEDSKFAMVMAKMSKWIGMEVVPGTPGYDSLSNAAPWVLLLMFTGLTYFGIRSTKRETPIAAPVALVGAVLGVLTAYGLVRLLLVVLPNGLIWSQPLALVLTLWVGFVGASMCTYENRHLRVEAAQRFLPDKIKPFVGFLSGLATTVVCLGLLWVSMRYVGFSYDQYVATEHQGGLVQGMSMPKYIGFMALPLSFGLMSIRFFVKGLAAARGEIDEPLDPVAAAGGLPDDIEMPPSEVATEALPVHGKPSAVDTMTSKSNMVDPFAPKPQSRVSTDAHRILGAAPSGALRGSSSSSGSLGVPAASASTSGPLADAEAPAEPTEAADPTGETKEVEGGPIPVSDETAEVPAAEGDAAGNDEEGSR